jgi:hypothetical protein
MWCMALDEADALLLDARIVRCIFGPTQSPLLHLAVTADARNCLKRIVAYHAQHALSLNQLDLRGVAALHYAVDMTHGLEMATVLLENGADPNVAGTAESRVTCPLQLALYSKCPAMVALLLKYGADPMVKHKGYPIVEVMINPLYYTPSVVSVMCSTLPRTFDIFNMVTRAVMMDDPGLLKESLRFCPHPRATSCLKTVVGAGTVPRINHWVSLRRAQYAKGVAALKIILPAMLPETLFEVHGFLAFQWIHELF